MTEDFGKKPKANGLSIAKFQNLKKLSADEVIAATERRTTVLLPISMNFLPENCTTYTAPI